MKRTKHILSVCLALLLLITSIPTICPSASAQSTSLIVNSSFEYNGDWATGSIYRTTDKAHTGSYSVKCSARGVSVCVANHSAVSVKPQTDYLYSGYIYRADNSTWGYIDMNDRTGELQLLNTEVYGKWVYVSGVWNSGNATSVTPRIVVEPNYSINQHLGAGITGDVWFDDITLTEIVYDSYNETPANLSQNAKSYSLQNADISVCIASDNNKEYLTSLKNIETGVNWIDKASELPLTNTYSGGSISWTLKETSLDNSKPLAGTGKAACHTLTLKYTGSVQGLSLNSYYKIYPTGPLYHYTEIINNTGKTISFSQNNLICADIQLTAPTSSNTVYRFNRSRFNNGFDGLFTTGVLTDKVQTDTFIKSVVENSWLANSGTLPFNIIQGNDEGLYTGYEWSYGELSLRTQQNPKKIRFSATLGNVADTIVRENGETLAVPPVFIGAYTGDADEGSNQMKKWFYNHLMTKSLRENENEPLIELHLPLFSEQDLKGYLYDCNLESWGVELTKMDYWWTVPSNSAFDANLEQQWNPYPSKWPSGMTYGHLVKEKYPSVKTSLYMCDTYQGVDIGTKEGRKTQIEALKTRLSNWNIDYWRSDFDVLKPNNYANHEGLMYILQSLIDWNDDFRYEHCSAGGSLKDFATLQKMTFMTMEDSGGALNHRMAFYSNSYMINPVQLKFDMGFDWRPSDSNEQNLINSNQQEWITYNVRTAMMGAMMVQNVSNRLNSQELSALKEGWKLYKEKQRPILKGADVYHVLPMPTGNTIDGVEYYNNGIEQGSLFLFRDKAGETSTNIKLKGLEKEGTYKLTFEDRTNLNCTKTGSELMSAGITVTGMNSAYDSEIVWIERTDKDVQEPTNTPIQPTEITTTVPTTAPTTSPSEDAKYILLGDAQQDEAVNIKDATAIQKHVAQLITLSDDALLCADADQNNSVNIKDATAIQKHIAGIDTGYPIGENINITPDPIPTVTQPTEPTEPTTQENTLSPDGTHVYMKNTADWSDVYCYYWSDSEGEAYPWHGVRMEHLTGDIYYYEVPQKYQNIIFNNGQGTQTADLKVSYSLIFNNSSYQWESFNNN